MADGYELYFQQHPRRGGGKKEQGSALDGGADARIGAAAAVDAHRSVDIVVATVAHSVQALSRSIA
jgi:hypothetical protein